MAEHNDQQPSISAVAEEDSSETTLSLPVLNLRLNSSETTETTLSGNVTPLLTTDGGPSEGTFASASGREIRFLPRPNSSANVNKSNRSEASRRNEFLFLLTTDSSNTTRSEDDDIRVEEEEDIEGHDDEKDDPHPLPPESASARSIGADAKKPALQQSLSSLYREIKFELRPQEADEEVEVLSRNASETKQDIGDEDDDHESTIEDDDEGEETIRFGEETDTDHTNTEATDETFSNSNLLSDAVLLLPRIRNHEDSIGSCCEEDDDVDDFECTAMFEVSQSPDARRAPMRPPGRHMEVSPSARTASKSTSTRTSSSNAGHSASHSHSESERSRAHPALGPSPGSPVSSHWTDRSASKSSSAVSVSAHPVDTPPVPPRRSPNTDESQKLPPQSPLRTTSPRVSSAPYVGKSSFSSINRRPSSPVFKDLVFEATKIITPSHSPLLSATASSVSKVQRVDGDDAPEIPAAAAAAAAASTSLTARLEEPKNLYEELLQFHRDQDDEDSTEPGTAYSGSSWRKASARRRNNQRQLSNRSQSVGSLQSIEDSKLPAQGLRTNRETDSNPYHYSSSPLYQELLGARNAPPDVTTAHATSARSQPMPGRTSLSHLEADEAIARILQEELDAEQRRTEEESLRAAMELQRQEEQALAARQQQTAANDNLLPLILPDGTSMEEQQRILEQIRQQQEEAQLRQALNMSSHSSPEDRGSMTNGLGPPSSGSPQVSHQPRYPPPQPHAYPHRRSTSHDALIAHDTGTHDAPTRGGSVNSGESIHRLTSNGDIGSVQPAATFPRASISDAFERQFRPRELAQPSSQRHRSMPSSDSPTNRPIGNGSDRALLSAVDSGSRTHRPEWERSQQEALREFQQRKNHQELYRTGQNQAPATPPLPASQLDLVQRGAAETARAVQVGRAHIVQCQNCQARLQAPIQYALVYCPSCGMVSPGRSYVPTTSASPPSAGSGRAPLEQGPTSPGGSSLQDGDASSDRRSWY